MASAMIESTMRASIKTAALIFLRPSIQFTHCMEKLKYVLPMTKNQSGGLVVVRYHGKERYWKGV